MQKIAKKKMLEYIHKTYKKELKNTTIANPKLWITFSAIPGSGKTFLAKKIEEHYDAVRIHNDSIRTIIRSLELETKEERQQMLNDFIKYLFEKKLKLLPNGLLVFDSSIDRSHQDIKKYSQQHGYPLFVIRLEAERENVIARLKKRDGCNADIHLQNLDNYEKNFQEYVHHNTPDIILKNTNKEDVKKIFSHIDAKLMIQR